MIYLSIYLSTNINMLLIIPCDSHYQTITTTTKTNNTNNDVEKLEPLCITGKNVKWGSPYGKPYGDFSKK